MAVALEAVSLTLAQPAHRVKKKMAMMTSNFQRAAPTIHNYPKITKLEDARGKIDFREPRPELEVAIQLLVLPMVAALLVLQGLVVRMESSPAKNAIAKYSFPYFPHTKRIQCEVVIRHMLCS